MKRGEVYSNPHTYLSLYDTIRLDTQKKKKIERIIYNHMAKHGFRNPCFPIILVVIIVTNVHAHLLLSSPTSSLLHSLPFLIRLVQVW